VIAGTATSVSNRVSRRQAARWSQQDEQAYAQTAPAAAPAPAQVDSIAQLKELAQLKDSGVLTQAEFDAQKAKILAG
jgi:membrane protease subunit (stomatin/prohibitin family)